MSEFLKLLLLLWLPDELNTGLGKKGGGNTEGARKTDVELNIMIPL
jgi:hypothetical protein